MFTLLISILLSFSCSNMVESSADVNTNVDDYATGVAPFAVFFDVEDYGSAYADEPFHDLEYRWNFGDTTNEDATWDYGARPGEILKNETTGPVSAHLYEEPGDYTATVTIWDGSEEAVKTVTYDITITDPDTVFSDSTYVISSDGDFTDAPEGAIQVTSSVFDTSLSTALASGAKRILYKAGQTFSYSSTTIVTQDGPILIGSFGSGDDPIISLDETYEGYWCIQINSDNVKIMDLEINGNGYTDPVPARGAYLGGDNCVALRIYAHDLGYMVSPGGSNSAIVECQSDSIVGGSGNMPIWANDVYGLFLAGCRLSNGGGGEYNFRYQGGTEGVITNNTFEWCGDGKCLFTLRGNANDLDYICSRHVISDNYFDGASCSSLNFHSTIVPQNNASDEPIRDVIYERNYHNSVGNPNMLNINARYITVRNNLFDGSLASQGSCINISYSNNSTDLPTPSNIYMYHNTFYSSSTNGFTGITIYNQSAAPYDCIAKNNFLYAPNTTINGSGNSGPDLYVDYGTDNTWSNNTDNEAVSSEATDEFTHFTVQPPSDDPEDWVLLPDSYANDDGESVSVWSDFFRTSLFCSTSRSLGAINIE